MGCGQSTERVHPSQLELPGQNYLGSCWQCSPDSPLHAIPTWTKSCSGQLPNRAFDIHAEDLAAGDRQPRPADRDNNKSGADSDADPNAGRVAHRNRSTGKNNGFLLPSVHCDGDGLEAFLSVFSDDDIKVQNKVSTHIKLAVGLDGVGVGGGAEKSKRHGSGSRDMYIVCNVETYRLSVDLARAVKMIQHETEQREQQQQQQQTTESDAATSSARFASRSGGGLSLYGVDPGNSRAFGDGCVTQVKCGGQLLIRIKQTNFGKQLEAWGASLELGLTTGGGARMKGAGHKRKEGGDQKLNVEVHHNGGPALPKQFHDATISDIESMVQKWADGLAEDALLAVPMRVGVHRYDTLESLLLIHSSPLVANVASPLIGTAAANNPREPASFGDRDGAACGICDAHVAEIARLQAELSAVKSRTSSVSDSVVADAGPTAGAGAQQQAAAQDEVVDLLASMIVPEDAAAAVNTSASFGGSTSALSPLSASSNQQALALYVAKAANGHITEVDLSQLPRGSEAVLWGAVCLLRQGHVVESLTLTNLRITDRDVPVLVHALQLCADEHRSSGNTDPLPLRVIDLSDNQLTASGAADIVNASVGMNVAEPLEVFLENNWLKRGDVGAFKLACDRATASSKVSVSPLPPPQ